MTDGAVVLDSSGVLKIGLALAVPVASESVTVGTELIYLSYQPECEALISF